MFVEKFKILHINFTKKLRLENYMYEGNAAKKLTETEELTAKEIIEKRRAFAEKKRKRYIKQTNPNLYKLMEYQDTRHERAKRRVEKRAETKEKIMRIPAEMVRISFLDYVIDEKQSAHPVYSIR